MSSIRLTSQSSKSASMLSETSLSEQNEIFLGCSTSTAGDVLALIELQRLCPMFVWRSPLDWGHDRKALSFSIRFLFLFLTGPSAIRLPSCLMYSSIPFMTSSLIAAFPLTLLRSSSSSTKVHSCSKTPQKTHCCLPWRRSQEFKLFLQASHVFAGVSAVGHWKIRVALPSNNGSWNFEEQYALQFVTLVGVALT
jgi:hypothetical protein